MSVHDGQPPSLLDGRDNSALPWASVQFENGRVVSVDYEKKFERISSAVAAFLLVMKDDTYEWMLPRF